MPVSFSIIAGISLSLLLLPGTNGQVRTAFACEGKSATMHCPPNTYIDVKHAIYGRDRGPSVCPHPSIRVTHGCLSSVSLSRVWSTCQGRSSCGISASNSIFGDPCVGTYKFLRVEYECSAIRRSRACESRTLNLHCPQGKVINTIHAAYGRNAGVEVCPSPDIRQISNCRSPSSDTEVSSRCDGRSSCSVPANNGVFGDPCVGTYKYLEVSYRCN